MINGSLLLEGGAARGVFTAGVLDVLMEQDIYLSHVVGVSAGCCNGLDYVSRQPGRSRDCMIHQNKGDGYMGLHTVLKKRKLIDMEKLFDYYPRVRFPFDFEEYSSSGIKAEWVVTNCVNGEAEYIDERKDVDRLMLIGRASCSMPMIAPMVKLDKSGYLDGGLADSIPIKRALDYGNEKLVAVMTRPSGYRKKPLGRVERKLCEKKYQNFPALIETIKNRADNYNESLELLTRLESEGRAFVIRPSEATISRMENRYEPLMVFYRHGCEIMQARLQELKDYLSV